MLRKLTFKYYFFLHFEWLALASGLLLMAMLDPTGNSASLCPLDRLGADFCPGEGLGRSIAYGFRGDFPASFQAHPAGLPAIGIILLRIGHVLQRNWQITNQKKDDESI